MQARILAAGMALAVLSACQTDSNVGEGPLELSPQVAAGYEEFKKLDNPGYFAVPPDGSTYGYSYCREFGCRGHSPSIALNSCNRRRPQNDCRLYAHKDKVLWQFPEAPKPDPGFDETWLAEEEDKRIGRGPLALSFQVKDRFHKWRRNPKPTYFAVSADGKSYGYQTCSDSSCPRRIDMLMSAIYYCNAYLRKRTKDKTRCYIYAIDGEVVWKFREALPKAAKRRMRSTASWK